MYDQTIIEEVKAFATLFSLDEISTSKLSVLVSVATTGCKMSLESVSPESLWNMTSHNAAGPEGRSTVSLYYECIDVLHFCSHFQEETQH